MGQQLTATPRLSLHPGMTWTRQHVKRRCTRYCVTTPIRLTTAPSEGGVPTYTRAEAHFVISLTAAAAAHAHPA